MIELSQIREERKSWDYAIVTVYTNGQNGVRMRCEDMLCIRSKLSLKDASQSSHISKTDLVPRLPRDTPQNLSSLKTLNLPEKA